LLQVANTLAWCLYRLSESASGGSNDTQEKVCDEARRLEMAGEHVSLSTAARMPHVKACIKETLRLRNSCRGLLSTDAVAASEPLATQRGHGSKLSWLFSS